jgi:sialic acid synthase SpsE
MISIGSINIGRNFQRPYIIAEAGVNHEGDIAKAKLMIDQVSSAGLDAIKFQTYKADKLASKNSPAYWDTTKETTLSQHELFKKYDSFEDDDYIELARYAAETGIHFLSTPFDLEAVDLLAPLMPAFKIASADITNFPLLEKIASYGKPILLSTGASLVSEIWEAMEILLDCGCKEIALLHCILNYPTLLENANLGMIKNMRELFPNVVIGYSDHVPSEHILEVLPAAWLLGANVIEKHFTFDKTLPGNDHYHAMDEADAKSFVRYCDTVLQAIGSYDKRFLESEEISRKNARRSLVAARDISEGEIVSEDMLVVKRPGTGLPPKILSTLIGSKASTEIPEDTILQYHHFQFLA